MSKVNRINSKCLLELEFILHPETAKLNQINNLQTSFTLTLALLVLNLNFHR